MDGVKNNCGGNGVGLAIIKSRMLRWHWRERPGPWRGTMKLKRKANLGRHTAECCRLSTGTKHRHHRLIPGRAVCDTSHEHLLGHISSARQYEEQKEDDCVWVHEEADVENLSRSLCLRRINDYFALRIKIKSFRRCRASHAPVHPRPFIGGVVPMMFSDY